MSDHGAGAPGASAPSAPAGWYADPGGSGGWRYFDGVAWSPTVQHGPVPTSAASPAGPAGPTPPGPSAASSPSAPPSPAELSAAATKLVRENPWLTAGIGDGLRRRPATGLEGVLAAVAGTLVAIGVLVMVSSGDDPSPWALAVVGAVLALGGIGAAAIIQMAGSWGARWPLSRLVSGSTALALIGITTAVLSFSTAVTERSTSASILWWPYLLLSVVLFAAWLLPGVQGRPAMLGASLLSGTWALVALFAVTTHSDTFRTWFWYADAPFAGVVTPSSNLAQEVFDAASMASVGIGLVLVLAAAAADHFGLRGISTPLLFSGVISAVGGGLGVAGGGTFLEVALLSVLALVILAVGALAGRKATLWAGGIMLTIGVIAAIAVLLNDGAVDAVGVGLFITAAGVVLGLVAGAAALWLPPLLNGYRANGTHPDGDVR